MSDERIDKLEQRLQRLEEIVAHLVKLTGAMDDYRDSVEQLMREHRKRLGGHRAPPVAPLGQMGLAVGAEHDTARASPPVGCVQPIADRGARDVQPV